MLKQQINLYQVFETPPETTTFLGWRRFLLINLGIFIWFCLLLIYSLFNLYLLKNQKQALLNDNNVLQSEFLQIKSFYPQLFFSQDANVLIKKLQDDVIAKEKILQELNHRIVFSKIMLGLSQVIVRNVWLTDIAISKNGNDILLKGHSIGTQTLQQFINNIVSIDLFKPYSLNINNIENPNTAAAKGVVNFEVNLLEKRS